MLQAEGRQLTLHAHVGRLVHEVHEELGGVDEDLVSAVADGAVPPGALWQMGRQQGTEVLRAIPNRKCVALLGKIGKTYNNNGEDDHEG